MCPGCTTIQHMDCESEGAPIQALTWGDCTQLSLLVPELCAFLHVAELIDSVHAGSTAGCSAAGCDVLHFMDRVLTSHVTTGVRAHLSLSRTLREAVWPTLA